ncbi:glycosyltransferase [Peptoniphilus sp. AGMB00490]|uniref:Glycosyltransferase n=1 Tax=Peptoniphilus faecalis TaxID=2731255 RepID=A0A848RI23_9FIRM|nr:glycosyltransferase [Peptoniphilus faecalis]NMW85441.1 glycosyltransferase [Peptoniphilus faecalis]
MQKIMLGLPAYNEEKNIGLLINCANKEAKILAEDYGFSLEIVPLDDCSTDETKNLMIKKKAEYGNVIPIFHDKNKNLGGGMNTLINYFLKNYEPGDILIIMDADNSHDPKYMKNLIEKLNEGFDIAIASRYQQGSKTYGVPKFRLFMTFCAKIYYMIVLNIKDIRDYTCGYRAYKYEILKSADDTYKGDIIENTSFACMMELIYKLYKIGAKIGEIPFVLRYDKKKGESSMNIKNTTKTSLITALKLRFNK